jgi:hypothetical protein
MIKCDCGKMISKKTLPTHIKTKTHKNKIARINKNKQEEKVHIADKFYIAKKTLPRYYETINGKSKNVTAMKFFKGQDNDRIYCKEIHSNEGVFIVVAAILYRKKKTTKLNEQQINLIEKVAQFEYEI